jgi:hypothetical protein
VVIRQAHPGEKRGRYLDYADKLESAREYQRLEGIDWPVLVDDYAGTVHRQYSKEMADPSFLIDAEGKVAFYGMWTHAPALKRAFDELLAGGGTGAPVAGWPTRPSPSSRRSRCAPNPCPPRPRRRSRPDSSAPRSGGADEEDESEHRSLTGSLDASRLTVAAARGDWLRPAPALYTARCNAASQKATGPRWVAGRRAARRKGPRRPGRTTGGRRRS